MCLVGEGETTEAAAHWQRHLLVYGLLAGGDALFNLVRSLLVGRGGLQASTKMHRNLLCSVLQVRLSQQPCSGSTAFCGRVCGVSVSVCSINSKCRLSKVHCYGSDYNRT